MHLIVEPQLGGGRRHNYSTKIRQAGHANEQSMYSLKSMALANGALANGALAKGFKGNNVNLLLLIIH